MANITARNKAYIILQNHAALNISSEIIDKRQVAPTYKNIIGLRGLHGFSFCRTAANIR